ncbi:MAG: hypothetical protein AAF962_03510 [Actinomycetota bacterium]
MTSSTAARPTGAERESREPSPKTSRLWSHPKQRLLLLLAAGIIIGAFLPWLETPVGTYRAWAGPGQYLFYAGVIGFAGGLVPIRMAAVIQGAIMSAVAITLPVWQILKIFSAVRLDGWVPGIGMILILGCGIMGVRTTLTLAGRDDT